MKRGTFLIVILGIFLVLGVLITNFIGTYNKLVKMDEEVNGAWSQVENVYQRRYDLIENLVNTVKGYANFEKETLIGVIEARSKATSVKIDANNLNQKSLENFQEAQLGISSALSKLMVVVEKYPELKANQNFLELQSQLEGTENRIAVERQRFNDVVKEFNSKIRTFPTNFIANFGGFKQKEYFNAEKGAEKAPKVTF